MVNLEQLINTDSKYRWIKRRKKRLCFIGIDDTKANPELFGVILPTKTELNKLKYDKYYIEKALIYDLRYFNTTSDIKEFLKNKHMNQYLIFNEIGLLINYSTFEITSENYSNLLGRIANNTVDYYKEPIKQVIL